MPDSTSLKEGAILIQGDGNVVNAETDELREIIRQLTEAIKNLADELKALRD